MNWTLRIPCFFSLLWLPLATAYAQTVIEYDGTTDPVPVRKDFSRSWTTGTSVDQAVAFSDTLSLEPSSDYSGPSFFGGASAVFTGTIDGSTPVSISALRSRIEDSVDGDQLLFSASGPSLSEGGNVEVSAAALIYFKSVAPFEIGDTSLTYTTGSVTNRSRFQWVLRDAGGTLYVSDMSIRIRAAGDSFQSNLLTSRKWAVLDTSQEDLAQAPQTYEDPGTLGLDFSQITGAGVYVSYLGTLVDSGSPGLYASIRQFSASVTNSNRDLLHLTSYYFGNSLTGGANPDLHGALGDSAGKSWIAYDKLGAGWQLWMHRYELYEGAELDPGDNGDLTLNPSLIGDSSDQIDNFISRPWEAMVLQPFGMGLEYWVNELWGTVFDELTDVGDIKNSGDLIDVFLAYNPTGKTYIYVNWPQMTPGIVPPENEWPEWTEHYDNTLTPGESSAEFPDRDAFDYEERYLDFYQFEEPYWTNDRGRTRDYYIKLFDALISNYPDLWQQGRLEMIPAADVYYALNVIYRAGGDPELDNPAISEKIDDIEDFYTDRQHIRAGMAQFTVAACFYTALYGEHPSNLDWTVYNLPTDYPSDPTHDMFPALTITEARAAQVCDVIWDVFTNHPFTGLRSSPFDAVSMTAPGTSFIWGDNRHGQLGKENQADAIASPEPMSTGLRLSVSGQSGFAVTDNGSATSWGLNDRGQLGDASFVTRPFPFDVYLLPPSLFIRGNGENSTAVTRSGEVWAWGANDHGQLGDDFGRFGDEANGFLVPPENARPRKVSGVPDYAVEAVPGSGFTVARFADGSVYAWGRNDSGQLGRGATSVDGDSTPQLVPGLSSVVQIAVGADFALALQADGSVLAWGSNEFGQLGVGDQTMRSSPLIVPALSQIRWIGAGARHALAVDENGVLYAWGDNSDGQLGADPDLTGLRLAPAAVTLGQSIARAVGGDAHTLALTETGDVYAWGANASGQLGNGTTTPDWNPAAVPSLEGIADVQAAGDQSFAQVIGEDLLPPTNLRITERTATSITVAWTDNSDNETGFTVEQSTSSDFSAASSFSVGPDVTVLADSNLPEDSLFYYRVRAENAAGSSEWSYQASALTLESGQPDLRVEGNGVEIISGSSAPSLTDHSDFGDCVMAGETVTRSFELSNLGDATLDLGGVSISGDAVGEFSILQQPAVRIEEGKQSILSIVYNAVTPGLVTATVNIPSDDPDEAVYSFAIQGTGVPFGASTPLLNGDFSSNLASNTGTTFDTHAGAGWVVPGGFKWIRNTAGYIEADNDGAGGVVQVIEDDAATTGVHSIVLDYYFHEGEPPENEFIVYIYGVDGPFKIGNWSELGPQDKATNDPVGSQLLAEPILTNPSPRWQHAYIGDIDFGSGYQYIVIMLWTNGVTGANGDVLHVDNVRIGVDADLDRIPDWWEAENSVSINAVNPLTNDDGDPLPNLLEYLFRLNPAVSDRPEIYEARRSGDDWVFDVKYAPDSNITVEFEVSPDMVNWVTAEPEDHVITPGGAFETHSLTFDATSAPAMFIRVKAE